MSEKTTDERIIECIWLHAYEPSEKIQAGILREFGENRSLSWIAQEQKAYLAEAKPSVEGDTATAPSTDEEAIKRVAEAFPSAAEELIRKIIWFKMNTRFGCRRISQKLNHDVGKDTVQGIWKMYESIAKPLIKHGNADKLPAQTAIEEEVAPLRERIELEKENTYLRLTVEGDALVVEVAEHEMAKKHLETYQRFRQYCEREHLSTVAALRKMGLTASYFLNSFDDWYDQQAEDGDVGISALAWTVTLDIDSFLRKQYNRNKRRVDDF